MERFLWLWSCWRSNKRFVIQIYVILITIKINIFEKKKFKKKNKNNSWSRCCRCCTINYWWWIGWLGRISGSSRLWALYCVCFSWRVNVLVGEQCCASVDTRCGGSRTTVVGTRRHRRQRRFAAHDLVALQSLCFVHLHVFKCFKLYVDRHADVVSMPVPCVLVGVMCRRWHRARRRLRKVACPICVGSVPAFTLCCLLAFCLWLAWLCCVAWCLCAPKQPRFLVCVTRVMSNDYYDSIFVSNFQSTSQKTPDE